MTKVIWTAGEVVRTASFVIQSRYSARVDGACVLERQVDWRCFVSDVPIVLCPKSRQATASLVVDIVGDTALLKLERKRESPINRQGIGWHHVVVWEIIINPSMATSHMSHFINRVTER